MTEIVYRLISSAGFSRVELKSNNTLLDLKKQIEKQLQINPKDQKLYIDQANKKPLNQPDSTSVTKLGLSIGDPIFLANSNAEQIKEEPKKEFKKKCNHSDNEKCINCMDKIKTVEKPQSVEQEMKLKAGLTQRCNHNVGQKCLHCMPEPTYGGKELKYNCTCGPNGKCPNCMDKDFIEGAKHRSFDDFLNSKKAKCKSKHSEKDKCDNCMPPSELVYKMKKGCPNHLPYPQGLCPKCMSPNVLLARQVYRHVDYVSFMNFDEMTLFVQAWQKEFCMKQRMAYLFGYFAKDPNYPDGVRAVVEALYEPPQIGDQHSVEALEDKDDVLVDRVAKGLTLECIGWVTTTIDTNKDLFITSNDVRKAARYQEKFKVKHPSGYGVSKFITVLVKPKDDGNIELDCLMVSDLVQALERDNVLGESTDKKKLAKRKADKLELLPDIFEESKKVESFHSEFTLVNVGHGAPKDKRGFNILKAYDFPIASRMDKGILTENHIKEYFKKKKKDTGVNKYGSFNFLIYLAKVIDIETAENIGKQIAVEETCDAELIGELLSSILGYD